MPLTKKGECTPRQFAYANRLLGGKGTSKKEIALNVGYSPNAAKSVKSKIENTIGFHSAMQQLALDSNNLALAAMHEFKVRGFKDFSNKDLVGALNAIGGAWAKFNERGKDRDDESKGNKLRTIVMQHIENQTMNNTTAIEQEAEKSEPIKVVDAETVDVDF